MRAMTAANLRSAFGGESMAHMRYIIWGDKAEKDGFPNVARLFRAVSRAEQAHATNHFAAMAGEAGAFLVASGAGFGLGSTSANLAGAIEGETFEIEEMYPAYMAVARAQGEKDAIQSIHYAVSAEKTHAAMYTEAKKAVDAGHDLKLGPVRICTNCGYTVEGGIPDKCPVCALGKDRFVSFAWNPEKRRSHEGESGP
jgi:rubrerythrin